MINNLAHYKVFSTFDLRNAYHQVPILKDDRKYTGFEANGRLYQFRRIPFGVTNGVAVFQRLMDNIIKEEKLKDTFPYLDDITVAGVNQADHDKNVEAFLDVVKRQNLTLNHAKSVISASSINVLGYLVRDGNIRPDPRDYVHSKNFLCLQMSSHYVELWGYLLTMLNGYQNFHLKSNP